ncbi:hypothetical protein DSO57_1012241 [Entomophthora muscae]|uniref:Uncharacterized protein n=1 Tax=Entomophthora muscae TaxID=34485 RepID=A0ACC2S8D0_9FUNG|nr:hypothetical protein DSO57_1012241 [Entomophthora muscae]
MDSPNSIPPSTPLTTNFYHPEPYSGGLSSANPVDVENLKTLANKRIATFAHLHRVLEGKSHYFNTITILREDIQALYENARLKKRSLQYFTLGSSLGPIVDINHPMDFAKALSCLLVEYEGYLTSDSGKSKRRPFFRKSRAPDESSGNSPSTTPDPTDFINLEIKNVPFELDYLQVFFALCNIVCVVYHKIVDNMRIPVPPSYIEQMYKVDVKFKVKPHFKLALVLSE